MKWYDYAYLVPIAIIIVVVTTPYLWYEAVRDILKGASDYEEQKARYRR